MRKLNPTLLALLGGLVVLLLLIAYFATVRSSEQDKVTSNEVSEAQISAPSGEKHCSNQATYDLVKRELFRRAAQQRGSDEAAYDRLAGVAFVRMENPV